MGGIAVPVSEKSVKKTRKFYNMLPYTVLLRPSTLAISGVARGGEVRAIRAV